MSILRSRVPPPPSLTATGKLAVAAVVRQRFIGVFTRSGNTGLADGEVLVGGWEAGLEQQPNCDS